MSAHTAAGQDNREVIERLKKIEAELDSRKSDIDALKSEIQSLRDGKASPGAAKTSGAESPAGKSFDTAPLLKKLEKGNARFVAGRTSKKDFPVQRKGLTGAQHPYAIVLTCSDSRVPPELLFDESLGQLFVIRNAGNVVDSVTLGSIEYAAEHLHAGLLVVLGHESCGAVTAAASGGQAPPNIGSVVWRIAPAVDAAKAAHVQQADLVHASVEENVRLQMQDAVAQSGVLKELVAKGEFDIIGGVYSLETGKVNFMAKGKQQ
ncbi:MAG TPA: carbonic anhydrase [Bacteroidota bacterium]|nr:carbonic anhydrase [Bacteroidota bacterium]